MTPLILQEIYLIERCGMDGLGNRSRLPTAITR